MPRIKAEIVLSAILVILIIVMCFVIIFNEKDENIENQQVASSVENNLGTTQKEDERIIEEEKEKSLTQGNLVCKYDEKIIYADDSKKAIYYFDTNSKEGKKIVDLETSIDKMYFDGENIYYFPIYGQGNGIYKINLEGNIEKLFSGITLQMCIYEDKIYYVNQIGYDSINNNPQGTLCVMEKTGENQKEIAKNVKNYFYIENQKIYYTTQSRQMYQINIDGTNQVKLLEGRKFPLSVENNNLIYIDYANQGMTTQMNLETKEENQIGLSGNTHKFLGTEYIDTIATLDDLTEGKQVSKLNQETGKFEEILAIQNPEAEIIYVSEKFVYYKDEDSKVHRINIETKEQTEMPNLENSQFLSNKSYKIQTKENENKEVIIIYNLDTEEQIEI